MYTEILQLNHSLKSDRIICPTAVEKNVAFSFTATTKSADWTNSADVRCACRVS